MILVLQLTTYRRTGWFPKRNDRFDWGPDKTRKASVGRLMLEHHNSFTFVIRGHEVLECDVSSALDSAHILPQCLPVTFSYEAKFRVLKSKGFQKALTFHVSPIYFRVYASPEKL